MKDAHSLVFKGTHTREIATIQNKNDNGIAKTDQDILQEAMLLIRVFCAERHFTIYYTRIWNSGGKTIFDVGSHSEFFHLIPEVQFHEDK